MASVTLAHLKEVSRRCGLTQSGRKEELLEAIKSRALMSMPSSYVSIDIGLVNLAFADISVDEGGLRVQRWSVQEVRFPAVYDPASYAGQLKEFLCKNRLEDRVLLVERQRHRSGGNSAVLEKILRACFLEIQLHTLMFGRCQSVLPGLVASYWGLPKGKEKKKAAVQVVNGLLIGGSFAVEDRKAWEESKKKDDLADCLLQGVAFQQWHHNANQFFDSKLRSSSQSMMQS